MYVAIKGFSLADTKRLRKTSVLQNNYLNIGAQDT